MNIKDIPIIILYIATTLGGVGYNIFKTTLLRKNGKSSSFVFLIGIICSFIVCIGSFLFGGCSFDVAPINILYGAIYGVLFTLLTFFSLSAIEIGPLGYTTIIINFSTAINAILGFAFFKEPISALKIIGIVVMLTCFVFTANTTGDKEKKATNKWLILSLLCTLCSAGVGFTQGLQQKSEFNFQTSQFLTIAFAVQFVLSIAFFFFFKDKEKEKLSNEKGEVKVITTKMKVFVLFAILTGICCFIINFINLNLVGMGGASIAFPLINGLCLLGTILASFFIFKEKLQKKQILGFALGIIAIILLSF